MSLESVVSELVRKVNTLEEQVRALSRMEVVSRVKGLRDTDVSALDDYQILQYFDGLWVAKDITLIIGGVGETAATIAGGVIAAENKSNYILEPEGGTGPDELDTITPLTGALGHILVMRRMPSQQVTVKHNTGNIYLPGGDCILDDDHKTLTVIWALGPARWLEVARS